MVQRSISNTKNVQQNLDRKLHGAVLSPREFWDNFESSHQKDIKGNSYKLWDWSVCGGELDWRLFWRKKSSQRVVLVTILKVDVSCTVVVNFSGPMFLLVRWWKLAVEIHISESWTGRQVGMINRCRGTLRWKNSISKWNFPLFSLRIYLLSKVYGINVAKKTLLSDYIYNLAKHAYKYEKDTQPDSKNF